MLAKRKEYLDGGLGEAFTNEWDAWTDEDGDTFPVPSDFRNSLLRFHTAGVEKPVIIRGIQSAMSNNDVGRTSKFKYFCGQVWGEIKSGSFQRFTLEELQTVEQDSYQMGLEAGISRY